MGTTDTINSISRRGFTIVELLIVIVIIAILATITLASYNGVQARANNSGAVGTANMLGRKVQAYYSMTASYPATSITTFSGLKSALSAYPESTLPASGINVSNTITAGNGSNTVKVELCTGGVRITPWDYLKSGGGGLSTSPLTYGSTTTCNAPLTAS